MTHPPYSPPASGNSSLPLPVARSAAPQLMQAEWLAVVMRGSFSEILVVDCATLRLVYSNLAARRNLQYPENILTGMILPDLAVGITEQSCHQLLQSLHTASVDTMDAEANTTLVKLDTAFRRQDGSTYPVQLRFLLSTLGPVPVFIAIGNDTSAQLEAAQALVLSETRFRAIMSNTPGLVYQFLRQADGTVSFPYLSEGCHALLGVTAQCLFTDSSQFLQLILAEDRPSWLESMTASSAEMTVWNWEGRIWIEEWKDIKWINLRGTPRALGDGQVQWEGIMSNITESKLEQAEIERSRAQLAELSAHVENVKEQERTSIAREIHDDLGGNLTAIKMALALLTRRLPTDNPVLLEKAAYLDALVDRTIESAHRISGDLRPGVLDFGIIAAIDWQAKEFEKQLGIPCLFESNVRELELHPDQAIALFRIFQEALTNIGKHAEASRVRVRLDKTSHAVRLEIADNGHGMAATDRLKPKSFGIRGMTERASALGGTLNISPAQGGGNMVSIRIPMPAPEISDTQRQPGTQSV